MVTDTMLYLSIAQNNWENARMLVNELEQQENRAPKQPLYNAVKKAASGDKIALFLLTILVKTEWNN